MNRFVKVGSTAVLAAGFMTAVHAQQFHPFIPDRGTHEVAFAASYQFEPNDSAAIAARWGYFFNRFLEAGVDGSYTWAESLTPGAPDPYTWAAGAFGNWNFANTTPWLPYVGLFLGLSGAKSISTAGSWGAQGGAKYFFNPNVAGFGELRYRDIQGGDDQWGIFFGLSIFFR
jgi:Outer membrane protein beta-barrel domain